MSVCDGSLNCMENWTGITYSSTRKAEEGHKVKFVAQWFEYRTLNQDNLGLNPVQPFQTLGKSIQFTWLQFNQVCE